MSKIFGDVHGQLRDVLLLFGAFGVPTHKGGDVELCSYVFNGDFVDRGAHQCELVAMLFALKVLYPQRVYLIRGNHEFRSTFAAWKHLGRGPPRRAAWGFFHAASWKARVEKKPSAQAPRTA